jgi:hypothetical protein
MGTNFRSNKQTAELLQAAFAYADKGWPVLPLQAGDKRPATRHGVHDATTDRRQIAEWWSGDSCWNIGIAAGKASGLIVFDVDPRNGGDDGWDHWIHEVGDVPEGPVQLTAGGGTHYLAEYDDRIRSSKLITGVDLLSDGRYFVACPSVVAGSRYEWEASQDPLLGVQPFRIPRSWIAGYQGKRLGPRPSSYGDKNLLPEGSRNDGLASLAGSMRRDGLSEDEILAALLVANEQRCRPPLLIPEVEAIAKSIAKYEPAMNLTISLGSQRAREHQSIEGDTALPAIRSIVDTVSNSAPIRWWIKGWIPQNALMMVHGRSGAGKSFIVLDWLMTLASGKGTWFGHRVKECQVLYLAGEGLAGLRARSAAWNQHHQMPLENMWHTMGATDLDDPIALGAVIQAVRVSGINPSVIAVDTLNRHMAGDENSARDTREMMKACAALQREFDATVILVHHVGNNPESSSRARGSSAWRAALDMEISVTYEKRGSRSIRQLKNKEGQPIAPVGFRLDAIQIRDWTDEDGDPITSAVVVQEGGSPESLSGGSMSMAQKTSISRLRRFWEASSQPVSDGNPKIVRSELIEWLTVTEKLSIRTAEQYLKQNAKDKMIFNLSEMGVIEPLDDGWTVIEPSLSSEFLHAKQVAAHAGLVRDGSSG